MPSGLFLYLFCCCFFFLIFTPTPTQSLADANTTLTEMALTTKILLVAMVLLMVDGIIELAFISSMVSWVHRRAGGDFNINYNGGEFPLHGKPAVELVDQGHTSNGAAGTAFVVIGLGGFLALFLRHRQLKRGHTMHGFTKGLYYFWLVMTILSAMLAVAALIYTFILTYQHMNQTIDLTLAASLDNRQFPNHVAYPEQTWTPENWFTAVLELPLAYGHDRSDINLHLKLMKGWRWNLIPLSVLGIAVAVLAIVDKMNLSRRISSGMHLQRLDKVSRHEAGSPEF